MTEGAARNSTEDQPSRVDLLKQKMAINKEFVALLREVQRTQPRYTVGDPGAFRETPEHKRLTTLRSEMERVNALLDR